MKNPRYAAQVGIGTCDCPSVHIMLRDSDGAVFAVGLLSADMARALLADLDAALAAIEKGKPDFRCVGNA